MESEKWKNESGLKEVFTPYYSSRSYDGHTIMEVEEPRKCGYFSIIFAVLALLVSVVMIVIGSLHAAPLPHVKTRAGLVKNNCTVLEYCGCPGEPMLPWYLIFGGCITIGLLIGWILITLVSQKCAGTLGRKTCCSICNFSCITLYFLLCLVLMASWLVGGTRWIVDLHQRKNYATHNPNQDTCDWFLYWFSLIMVTCGLGFVIFASISMLCHLFWNILCCRPCRKLC